MDKDKKNEIRKGEQTYPGVSIDNGLHEEVSEELIREQVSQENNNPRNDED